MPVHRWMAASDSAESVSRSIVDFVGLAGPVDRSTIESGHVLARLHGDETSTLPSRLADRTSTSDEDATPHSLGTGRRMLTDGGRNRSEQHGADESVESVGIEFLDRETVRFTDDLADVLVSLFWWDESGQVGTITEPVGGVDGERVVTASEAFAEQEFAVGPIVTGVEGFTSEGPRVPGTGDVSASNPDVDEHVEDVRAEYDGPDELAEPFPDRAD